MPRPHVLFAPLLLVLAPACVAEDALAPQDGTCEGRWSDVAPVDLAAIATPTDDQRRVGPTPGSFTRDVQIPMPRHRGIEPRLSLHYDSARAGGALGVGWVLGGVPHIERAGDRVYLAAADGELVADAELVPCTVTGGTHCTRRQSFARVVRAGDAWVLTTPDGVASTFVAGAGGEGGTTRWVLSRVTDPSSRQVVLDHACDGAGCRLRAVTDDQSRVDLAYDDAGLLTAIDVTVAGRPVRALRLAYVASPETGRALLESITDLGRDAGAAPLTPPTRFGYRADLLVAVDNGIGGREEIVYWPAARFGAELPFDLPLVRAVTTSDGRSSWTSARDYLGATWDAGAGRILFAAVTEHVPVDPRSGAYLDRATRYSVDPATAGAVLSVSEAAGDACGASSPDALRQVEHTYQTTSDGAVLRVATDTTNHGADGSVERRRVEWEYDALGNVHVERDLGDERDPDDGSVRTTDRVPNPQLHLVVLPARTAVSDIHGSLLDETFYFYDGTYGEWDRAPTAGRLQRVGRSTGAGELIGPYFDVDPYGNTTAMYRPELHGDHPVATWQYDEELHELEVAATAYSGFGIAQPTTTEWELACAAPSSRTSPAGIRTTFTYDALCRPIEERDLASGRVVRRSFQPGLVREETTAGDAVTWIEHQLDGLGREWRTVSSAPGAPIVVERELSPAGLVVRETAPHYDGEPSAVTETAHDALGRVVRVTHPDGTSRATLHTASGTETTDELGHRRRHHRDGDELVDEEWSGGAWLATRRRFDALGRLLAVVDTTGRTVTSYEYDRLGRVTRSVDADRGVTTYEHRVEVFATDGAGRSDRGWSVIRVDAAGRRTTTQHDWLGRKRWEWRDGDGDTGYSAGWLYEEAGTPTAEIGRLRGTTFWAGTRRHFYDAAGNAVRTETWLRHGPHAYRFVTERGFDAAGRLRWLRYPDGDMLGTPERPLGYDAAGRVASAAAPDLELVRRIDYTAAGQPSRIEMGNGAVTERSYSPERGWLTALATTLHGVEVQRLTIERDAEGIIRGVDSQPRYERWSRHERWRYELDELHRLTSAIDLTDDAYSQRFRYDDVGNMTYNSLVGEYRYGTPDGQLPHAVTSVEADGAIAELGYDATGNLVSGSPATAFEREILYGQDGRPRAVRKWSNLEGGGFSRADTFYDADGARVVKRVQDGRTSFYLGDGFEISASDTDEGELTDLVATKQIVLAGLPVAERSSRMGWWCDTTGTGDTGCLQHIDTTWLHVDHLGSVQARTTDREEDLGESEHASGRMKYRPYGLPLVPGQLGHTYAGAEQDETGLVYLGARYYDPFLARFVSPDPTHPGPGVGLNRYAYANDNPISYVDPTGYSTARPPADGPPEGGRDDGGGGDEDPPLPPMPPVGPSGGPGAGDPVAGPQLPVSGPELPAVEPPPLTVVVSPDLSPAPAPISATVPITIGGDDLGAEDALALGGLVVASAVVAGAAVAICSSGACPTLAAATATIFTRLGPSRSRDYFEFGLGLLVPSGKPPTTPKGVIVGALRQVDGLPPASADRLPAEPAPGPATATPAPSGTPVPGSGWSGGGSW